MNIYSNRKQKSLKQSLSTGNINVHSEDFAFKLGSQLNLLRKRKESFHVIDENIGDVCEKCKEQDEDEKIENGKVAV